MDFMHTAQGSNVPLIAQLLLCFLRAAPFLFHCN
ncbi:hypothetical protein MUK42_08914 [Musa troglodytarum]|uniref:Uncharacterized protein n=1 Tax=Musa troglodytarum TaxID=320322 RepID=A0A9E7J9V3_9LILI|nr:hypothetical protein MUK42_08914 [Musa troglodytarum]